MIERVYQRVLMALRSFFRRRTADRELDDELQFHLDEPKHRVKRGSGRYQQARRVNKTDFLA
jgi:hypothetical protein